MHSLFSNQGNIDSNDALRYNAPKEPRQKSENSKKVEQKASPVVGKPSVSAPTPQDNGSLGPSKIMGSATIRLYKINPTTRAYESVEGGTPLGCVAMGTGNSYQILVYNGQRVPQAVISILETFNYTLRDLYMSLTDTSGNSWSLLFDSPEAMSSFLMVIGAMIAHTATHRESQEPFFRRPLPLTAEEAAAMSGSETETGLTAGSTAGVYLRLWEMGGLGDYPGDIVNGTPLKSVQSPDDVVKVKIGASEDPIGGFSEALMGCKKGEKFIIGISPSSFYQKTSNSVVDPNSRKHPGSWILLEVEVAKIKYADGSKKKANTSAAVEPVLPTSAPETPKTNENKNDNSTGSEQSTGLAARMAKMSAMGGGNQLAGIMNGGAPVSRNNSIQQQTPSETVTPTTHKQQQQQPEQPQVQQPEPQLQPEQQQYHHHQQQQQQQQRSSFQQQQSQQRSNDTGYWEGSGLPPRQFASKFRGFNPSEYSPSTTPMQSEQSEEVSAGLVVIQRYLVQLQGKVDQVSMQLSSSIQMQQMHHQQQQQQQQGMIHQQPYGMNMMPNIGSMGNNPFSVQQQLQQMQQMLVQQQQVGSQGMASVGTAGVSPVRLKAEELQSNLQFILQEYEMAQKGGGASEEELTQLKKTVTKLQERNETLQLRNEKLMDEKSDMLTKQAELLQSGGGMSSQRLNAAQQELDELKKEKQQLESNLHNKDQELQQLRSKYSELEQSKEQEKAILKSQLSAEHTIELQSKDSVIQDLHFKLTEAVEKLCAQDDSGDSSSLKAANKTLLEEFSRSVSESEKIKTQLSQQLNESETTINQLKDKIAELEQAVAGGGYNDGGSKFGMEEAKELLQQVYSTAGELFMEEEGAFSGEDVMKRLRAVLKRVTNGLS